MPQQPHRAQKCCPEMEPVANEGEAIGHATVRMAHDRSVNCIDRHRTSPPKPKKSAAELTFGGRHLASGTRIDRDRRAQRPRQTLEAGFGDMMAVLAI